MNSETNPASVDDRSVFSQSLMKFGRRTPESENGPQKLPHPYNWTTKMCKIANNSAADYSISLTGEVFKVKGHNVT